MSEPQRDVQQVVTLLRELVARQAMGHCERYDADADAFYAEKHRIAPGRSIPPAMNAGEAYERQREEWWEQWNKARAERWTHAMATAADLLDVLPRQIEIVAEAQARAVQRELDEIGIGGYPVSPHPECDSVSDALYIDTKARLIEALNGLFMVAPDAQKTGA